MDLAFGHIATLGAQQIRYGPQGRGFTGTVGAQQGNNPPLWHTQGHALEHQNDVVVNHFDAIDVQQDGRLIHLAYGLTHNLPHAMQCPGRTLGAWVYPSQVRGVIFFSAAYLADISLTKGSTNFLSD